MSACNAEAAMMYFYFVSYSIYFPFLVELTCLASCPGRNQIQNQKPSKRMHLVIAFLLQSAAVSSFLGGSYPGFKAPAPRKTPPTTSVCIVTDAEYSAAGDGVHDDTAAIRKVRDVGLHVPTPTRTHPPPASHQPPATNQTRKGIHFNMRFNRAALHYTAPHRAALHAKAIADCPRSSDGTFQVVLPAGKSFLTGALNLSSGIELVVNGSVYTCIYLYLLVFTCMNIV